MDGSETQTHEFVAGNCILGPLLLPAWQDVRMRVQPPIFYNDTGDVSVHESVEHLSGWLEAPDLDADEKAWDSAGRLLRIKAVGNFVSIEPAEEIPTHAEELRQLLVEWLESADHVVAGSLSHASLADLVERSREHLSRYQDDEAPQPTGVKAFLVYLAIMVALVGGGLWMLLHV
jgi:hypothetical protein